MNPQTLPTGAQLTPFLLDAPARAGVLVLPGGGYVNLATDHEGAQICRWLNARGFDAWMLEYHVANAGSAAPLLRQPLDDVGAALAAMRAAGRAQKLGVWGFSAGGHLAAMAATQPDFKLDWAVLAYPVIEVSGPLAHAGSARNLLGEHPTAAQIEAFSPARRVALGTPPTFLFHTAQDDAVPVENSLRMASALAAHRVPFELHVYQRGGHGVGLALNDGYLQSWSQRLEAWLALR